MSTTNCPNKIYIQPDIEEDDLRLWLLSPFNDKSIPYIRKDTLLEWAKEIEKNALWVSIDGLIEKINSL